MSQRVQIRTVSLPAQVERTFPQDDILEFDEAAFGRLESQWREAGKIEPAEWRQLKHYQ
jgi:hypothetical protein